MTFAANCKDCTNAGIRKVKALVFWTCDVCGEKTDKYACPNICGTRRP
jgi:ribosomal protein L37AE/L43A